MKRGANKEKRVPISISLGETTLKKLDDFCKENYNAQRSEVIEEALMRQSWYQNVSVPKYI